MKIKKLYWSPSAFWNIEKETLFVNNVSYPDEIRELFPEFYFLTLKGISVTELLQHYQSKDGNAVIMFVEKLLSEKLLIHSIDSITGLFHSQDRIYQDMDNSGDEVKSSPEQRQKFTYSALNRHVADVPFPVKLTDIPAGNMILRHSVREFDSQAIISFEIFSEVLSVLRDYGTEEKHKYLYPSGGGLYPVDVYIFVKENRVDDISQGLYLFSPVDNTLKMIAIPENHFREAHYFANRDIHENSAFSVYLVYNAAYSMPKYDGLGYYLGIADGGIMSQALTMKAFSCGIGSCIIGEMDFEKISGLFRLTSMQKYLHCIEFGIEKGICENENI